jgi:hypothetical protein
MQYLEHINMFKIQDMRISTNNALYHNGLKISFNIPHNCLTAFWGSKLLHPAGYNSTNTSIICVYNMIHISYKLWFINNPDYIFHKTNILSFFHSPKMLINVPSASVVPTSRVRMAAKIILLMPVLNGYCSWKFISKYCTIYLLLYHYVTS